MCVHFSNLFGPTLASVGVDIFFMLSGFLITTLLLVETETTGQLSFRNFYIRRALRLTPVLLLAEAQEAVRQLARTADRAGTSRGCRCERTARGTPRRLGRCPTLMHHG